MLNLKFCLAIDTAVNMKKPFSPDISDFLLLMSDVLGGNVRHIAGFYLGTCLAAFLHHFFIRHINLTMKGPFPHLVIKYAISLRLFVPHKQRPYQIKAYLCLFPML